MFTRIAKTKHASASLFIPGILELFEPVVSPNLELHIKHCALFNSMYRDLNQKLWLWYMGPKEGHLLCLSQREMGVYKTKHSPILQRNGPNAAPMNEIPSNAG